MEDAVERLDLLWNLQRFLWSSLYRYHESTYISSLLVILNPNLTILSQSSSFTVFLSVYVSKLGFSIFLSHMYIFYNTSSLV